jgi:integrase/recombinase XerD
MTADTTIGGHVDDYLRMRRALGYRLERAGQWLHHFAEYLEQVGETKLTRAAALAWAGTGQPTPATSNRAAARLGVIRKFAVYLQAVDPATEVPPSGVFPFHRRRPTPYLWSSGEMAQLLAGARAMTNPLRAVTHEALFGLLAATGMRLGEAIGLEHADVDLRTGVITIRQAKFDRSRLVPMHPSVTAALRRYVAERDRLLPAARSAAFFTTTKSTPLSRSGVETAFRDITTRAGIRTDAVRPRIHDLRHSLAVRTILEWQRNGLSIDEHIGALSIYLGHVSPADTYWYLSAAPELMQLAAQRLSVHFGAKR